ncbi:hypothetical protein AGDE_13558 [Angomonas deanei]|uniref:Poly [ADP-ribose] polymerase n=1 Tax=Angomonas deanei TaxID=59799 RepID=A0A7G2CF70_9TRYP|nr:hypothetical protein AGDE_13558 [Angomonas deanei]CAD2218426.1 hypothetical protein, conserved [Angomonas deanei]|eukprot:EPY22098.1 hypothetical protein AGDE_13558 [Angomonas deanei]
MEKLHERATRIAFRKAGERASGVTVPEEPPREATKGEVSELKRHQTNDCERCTQSRIPCNGVLEVLEGKFITIGNKKKYKARMKKMEKLKAQSVLTGKPPNNTCKVLYHQTSEEAAEKILSSQKMKRGSDGLLGSGIYFAASPEETQYKASQKGVILRCVVYLGKQKEVKEPGKHTFITLRKENYDSVHAISGDGFLPTGDEHVVYNWDQVLHVSRVD